MVVLLRAMAHAVLRAALCAVFLIPVVAAADPIVLTDGEIDVVTRDVDINLIGPGFSFQGGAHVTGGRFAPDVCSAPTCSAGTVVSLDAGWLGNDLPGTATFRGVTYSPVGGLGAADAQMLIELFGSFTVPPRGGLVKAPFTLNGQFSYPTGPNGELSSIPLIGQGLASVWLAEINGDPGFFFASRVRYDVDDAVPTPEPGSLVLLTGAIAWAAVRRRRTPRQ